MRYGKCLGDACRAAKAKGFATSNPSAKTNNFFLVARGFDLEGQALLGRIPIKQPLGPRLYRVNEPMGQALMVGLGTHF